MDFPTTVFWAWNKKKKPTLLIYIHTCIQNKQESIQNLKSGSWEAWLKKGVFNRLVSDLLLGFDQLLCIPKVLTHIIGYFTLPQERSVAGHCGWGWAETNGTAAKVFGPPGEPAAVARAAAASLMVIVEEQTEEVSSASPATAEWKLWPELLKPLTLSPDDSELSTATTKGRRPIANGTNGRIDGWSDDQRNNKTGRATKYVQAKDGCLVAWVKSKISHFSPLSQTKNPMVIISTHSHKRFWPPPPWSRSSSSRPPGGEMYPTRPPEAALLFGPHMYPTGDRDPRPEDEEDDEVLPEPTDFGRPPGRTSCEPGDPTGGSTLLSVGGTVQNKLDNTTKSLQTLLFLCVCVIPSRLLLLLLAPLSRARIKIYNTGPLNRHESAYYTSSYQNTVDSSVADSCVAGLDVHERLVPDSHEHSLLHADLWKTHIKSVDWSHF